MKPPRMTLDEIVGRIVEEKGLSRKQVFDLIEKKKTLLSHMISDEGAADIVAKELGVKAHPESDDEELALTVADLVAGMSNVTITGRVVNINPIKEFTDRTGNKGYVCNLVIADKSGDMRVVLWGDMTNLVHDDKIKQGAIVRISDGYVKEDLGGKAELHVGRRGHVEIEPQDVDRIDLPEMLSKPKRVAELKTNMVEADFIGTVKEIIPARATKTKDGREVTISSLIAEDDLKATIRVVFWNDKVSSMGNMKKGDKVEITSGRIRVNKKGEIEIHVGSGTTAKVNSSQSEIIVPQIHETRRISELAPGIQNYPIEGIVAGTPTLRLFKRKDGSDGKLISFTLSDGASTIRTVAWGDTAEKLRTLKNGDLIRIKESAVKPGIGGEREIQVKHFEILSSSEKHGNTGSQVEQCVNRPRSAQTSLARRKDVSELMDGEIAEIRGMITRIQSKSPIYRACPKCLRKVEMKEGQWHCAKDGDIGNPEVRTLYSLTLDDGTGTVTCVLSGCLGEELLGTRGSQLLASANTVPEEGTTILSSLLGLEIIFIGKCMFNPRQRRNEFRVSGFIKPDPRMEANILLEQIRKDFGA